MELIDITSGLSDFGKLHDAIKKTKGIFQYEKIKKQYDPKLHDVITDKLRRPDKKVPGKEGTKIVPATRLAIPLQKLIVGRAAAFLCGNPVELIANAEDDSIEADLLEVLKKTWDDNKLDYESKKIAKLMMSETEVAELWYAEEADENYWKNTPNDKASVKTRLRMKILANKYGDSLFPVYNEMGDMIAFGRGYSLSTVAGKEERFDLYTDEKIYCGVKKAGVWVYTEKNNPLVNEFNKKGKIPIIYYSQESPEWSDVQEMIDRLEFLISKHSDTNDYFGSPTLLLETEDEKNISWSEKGEDGKAAVLKGGAKASYLTWENAPESVKLEYNNLRSLIMDMTDTPDLSFEQVKGLGSYSGIALKMLFLGAHMKASDKEEIFGKGIQRRINFLKAALAVVNTDFEAALQFSIKPRFKFFLPKNEVEEINTLLSAVSGEKPIMSQKTAIELNPLVEDTLAEEDRIKEERESSDALDNVMRQ